MQDRQINDLWLGAGTCGVAEKGIWVAQFHVGRFLDMKI